METHFPYDKITAAFSRYIRNFITTSSLQCREDFLSLNECYGQPAI